jgi:hypothetical protein
VGRLVAIIGVGLGCYGLTFLLMVLIVERAPAGNGWLYVPLLGGPVGGMVWVFFWTRQLRVARAQWGGVFAFVFLAASYVALGALFAVGYAAARGFDGQIVEGASLRCVECFLDRLYFSVVTASTLGYGDLRPTGVARALACSEVILFWLFFAVGILLINAAVGGRGGCRPQGTRATVAPHVGMS